MKKQILIDEESENAQIPEIWGKYVNLMNDVALSST